jgi:FkbM family methyltransferase
MYDTGMGGMDRCAARRRGVRRLRRLGADVWGVLRVARPASAARWLCGLAVRAPQVLRSGSLVAADHAWRHRGARFRTPRGRTVVLPGGNSAGAREMYCRNVYLRTGLRIPDGGWVLDLGANAGLFTVLAAVDGARVLAVEAQQGFPPETARLLALNGVPPGAVHVEVALAGSGIAGVPLVGVVADAARWRLASHAAPDRPAGVSVPELLSRYGIGRVGLVKMDIEGSEFSVLHADSAPAWLPRVDQLAMEVHPEFGSVAGIVELLRRHGFAVTVTDNDGRAVPAASPQAAYLYARVPAAGRHGVTAVPAG